MYRKAECAAARFDTGHPRQRSAHMYRQSAHPYQVHIGFRKALRLGLGAGPGVLLRDRGTQLGLLRPLRLPRRSADLLACTNAQYADSSWKESVCVFADAFIKSLADGRVSSLDATDISPEQCRQQCEFAHELVAHEAWV